jgi:hypothetical protein
MPIDPKAGCGRHILINLLTGRIIPAFNKKFTRFGIMEEAQMYSH